MRFLIQVFLLFFVWSDVESQSLFDQSTLRDLHIDFYQDNWEPILVEGWEQNTGIRLPAQLTIDGIGVFDSVNVRYKGNSTFSIPNDTGSKKKPWNIDLDDFIEQEIYGIDKIKLANGFFDPSLLREVMGFDIYNKYLPSPRANHMRVHVEGDYLGLYINTETIDKQFLKKHFDYKKGILFKCDPSLQFGDQGDWEAPDLRWYGPDSTDYIERYDLKTDSGWQELIKLIEAINLNPSELPNVLNIDRALWYLAATNVMCNFDSYPGLYIHNYYLYQHENGLWQIIPWDVSEAFIGVLKDNQFVSPQDLYNWDIFLENDPSWTGRPLMNVLFENPLYRKQYLAHIRTILSESFKINSLEAKGLELQNLIAASAEEDGENFFGFGSFFFESNLYNDSNAFFISSPGILDVAEKRRNVLINHPEVSLVGPEIISVTRDIQNPMVGDVVKVSAQIEGALNAQLMVSKNKWASHFEAIEMMKVSENVFEALIPFTEDHNEVHYYIRAQNDVALSLSPARAEYEFYSYTIDGLTSQTEALQTDKLQIFPNPSSEYLNVQFTDTQLLGKSLKLYAMDGRLVLCKTIDDFKSRIILNALPSGNYRLTLAEESHQITVIKE